MNRDSTFDSKQDARLSSTASQPVLWPTGPPA